MFNDTQQQIYKDAWGFIESKLDFYISRIIEISDDTKRQSALNAFYFCMYTVLTLDKKTQNQFYHSPLKSKVIEEMTDHVNSNKKRVDATTQFFFPADAHSPIRTFFSELHDFLYGQGAKNFIVASVIDPRFFSSKNPEDRKLKQQKLLQEFGKQLYQDCDQWFSSQYQLKRFDKNNMPRIEKRLIEKDVLYERDKFEAETATHQADKWGGFRKGM